MKKYPLVKQDDLKDCGVCSLLSIIKYYNGNVSKEYLREITNTTRHGTNLYLLMEAAKNIGFSSKAVKGDLENLDKSMLPVISHVVIDNSYEHFIVIYEIDKKKKTITVMDSAKGIEKLSFEKYKKISTNHYLLLNPSKPIPNLQQERHIIKFLKGFSVQYKNLFLFIFLCSSIYTIANIILSYHFQFIIESALNIKSINNLYFISFLMLLVAVLKVIMDYFRNKLLNLINHKLDYNLVKNIFEHIISLPYLYYKNRTTGEITARINDVSEVKEALSRIIITLFVDIILVLFVFIELCRISMALTTVLIIITLIYILLILIFNPLLNKRVEKSYQESSKLNSFMIEAITSVDTIKNNLLEEHIKDDFDIKYSNLLNISFKLNNIYNIEDFIKELIYYIGIVIIIFMGSKLVINNTLSLAKLITYNSLLIYYLEPIKSIFSLDLVIKRVKNSIKRANELLEIPEEVLEVDKKYQTNKLEGNIRVNNLTYSYNGKKTLLNNLNINIKTKDKVLIYGKSGEGKSTLAKILMGYLKVENNKIFIDNKDINNYNLSKLRKSICYVSQNEYLYTDTIYNNITLNKNTNYDTFLDVVKITKTDEIVKDNMLLYDMLLEENGFNISGGERQRIILSRALLTDADIFIFDESLSQIDINRERIILKNIFEKLKDKTVIVISHRFNNKDLFNRLINLNGRGKYV